MTLVRPTVRGMVMLFATSGCVGSAIVNVNMTTALIASCMMAVCAASFILAFMSVHKIELRRASNRDGVCGSSVHLPFVITNHSWLWRQAMVVRERLDFTVNYPFFFEAVESLRPYESRLVKRPIPALKRGFYKLKRLDLIGGDPAGFFCRVKSFTAEGEVMIYPESNKLSQLKIFHRRQGILSVTGRPLGVSGAGQEFFGVREYSHHDEMRFIHWKSSARHRKLMVKEFEANSVTHVYLILDSQSRLVGNDFFDSNFELLIKIAASIVEHLADMHCRLSFVSADKDEILHFRGEAVGIRSDIINSLAMISPGKLSFMDLLDRELDRFSYNSIFYCLTMSEPEGLAERLDVLTGRGVESRWVYAPRKLFPSKEIGSGPKSRYPEVELISKGFTMPVIARQDSDIVRLLCHE